PSANRRTHRRTDVSDSARHGHEEFFVGFRKPMGICLKGAVGKCGKIPRLMNHANRRPRMNRLTVLTLILYLAATSPCVAGMPTDRFTIDVKGEFLAVSKGQLVFGASTFGSVSDNKAARDRWYVLGTLIKSSVGGGYLAYDLTGASNAVVLQFWPG